MTALNALAKHYGISVGVEGEPGNGYEGDDRPPPLHKRIEAGKFGAPAANGAGYQESASAAPAEGGDQTT